jgi:hypothetical protein
MQWIAFQPTSKSQTRPFICKFAVVSLSKYADMITGKEGESAVVALNQKLTKGELARKESGIPPSPTKRVTTDPSPEWRVR